MIQEQRIPNYIHHAEMDDHTIGIGIIIQTALDSINGYHMSNIGTKIQSPDCCIHVLSTLGLTQHVYISCNYNQNR